MGAGSMKLIHKCEKCGCSCVFTQHFRQSGKPGVPKFGPFDLDAAVWKKVQ